MGIHFDRPFSVVSLNMSTYADWQSGMVNRNYFVLKNLLEHPNLHGLLSIDFIHYRKKRLAKDFVQNILLKKNGQKTIFRSSLSRCSFMQEKHFVYSTFWQVVSSAHIVNEIQRLMRELKFTENTFFLSYNPLFIDFFDAFPEYIKIFDTVDLWTEHPSFITQRSLLEKNYHVIARKSNGIFTVSRQLLEFYKKMGREDRVWFLPNGVDLSSFQQTDLTARLRDLFFRIPRPIVGYVGIITQARFAIELVDTMVQKNHQFSFVFLGPVWKDIQPDILNRLSQYKNVYFLGPVPYRMIPGFIFEFDICWHPVPKNRFTLSMNPMKWYEYLALGKPVITGDLPMEEEIKDLMYVAHNAAEFHEQLHQALYDDSIALIERRKNVVQDKTYAQLVNRMLEHISRL